MLTDAVAELDAAVRSVQELDPHRLSSSAMVESMEVLFDVESRLHAVQAAWLGVATDRDATVEECGRATRSWLIEEMRLAPAAANRRMRLARLLPAYPPTKAAFDAAEINADHAHTIIAALMAVPIEFRDAVETGLLAEAREGTPLDVARRVEELLAACGVDDPSDERAARKYARRNVSVVETFAGTGSLSGTLTAEVTEKARLALHSAAERTDPDDERTASQRMHDAFGEICDFYLSHAELADQNGERPRIVVTMDIDTLLNQLSTVWATLDSGMKVSPETARRLACDAGIIPAVLGSKGDVLEMGRLSRSFSAATRRAAKLRQGGRCAYPRCRRRIVECHHVIHWARGGLSDLANAAWLCAFHHWLVHEGDWSMLHDPGGGFIFTAPDGRRRYSPRCPEAA